MTYLDLLKEGAASYGLSLTEQQLTRFDAYYHLLTEWNEKINLTAITEERDVVIKHFLDSLSGASVFEIKPGMQVLDVGTGGGFPGMALAIAFPEADFTLMDATGKKVNFLNLVTEELQLSNVKAVQGRAEELAHDPSFREKFDVVTSRAVAALPVLLEYTAGFVKKGGLIAAYKGPSLEEEMKQSENALKILGLKTIDRREISMEDYSHTIAIFEKTKPLPERYPRPHAQIKKKNL